MKNFNDFFKDLNDIISNFGIQKTKKKRKYTKRTFKVNDKDVITEFHPERLFNTFQID